MTFTNFHNALTSIDGVSVTWEGKPGFPIDQRPVKVYVGDIELVLHFFIYMDSNGIRLVYGYLFDHVSKRFEPIAFAQDTDVQAQLANILDIATRAALAA